MAAEDLHRSRRLEQADQIAAVGEARRERDLAELGGDAVEPFPGAVREEDLYRDFGELPGKREPHSRRGARADAATARKRPGAPVKQALLRDGPRRWRWPVEE